ncbi:MAG: phosphotransferase [Bacilli bacterium]|nr:phosphotransferase [Bacilli bacterium]
MILKSDSNLENEKINKICALYDLIIISYKKASNNHDSYKIIANDNKIYYLKEIPRVDIVNRQEQIIDELKKYNIKTYKIIKTKTGENFIKYMNKKYILINDIEGIKYTNKDLSNYKILKECARLLALLHMALKNASLDNIKKFDVNEIIELYIYKQRQFIKKNKLDSIMKIVENEIVTLSRNKPLNSQLIHGDFHIGNLLFNNDCADIILDFDLAINGNVYFDIAYFIQRFLKEKDKIQLFLDEYKYNNPNLVKEEEKIYLYLLVTELIVMNYFIGKEKENSALECINDLKYILENKKHFKELL